MFITPGEIARGQWLMIHSPRKEEKEKTFGEENPMAGLGVIMMGGPPPDPLIPHIVLSVQLPFIAVSDCTTTPCLSKVWRTDDKNFVEVKEEFVQALDTLAWHRGQKLLNPAYVMPMPPMPSYKSNMGSELSDLINQLMAPQPAPPKAPPKAPRKRKTP